MWRLSVIIAAVAARIVEPASPQAVTLNNGVSMPVLSLGTAGFDDAAAEAAVVAALGAGFRGIDTAFNYYNQAGVGRGIKRASNRSDVFVVTKTSPCLHTQAPPRYNITDISRCEAQTRADIDTDLRLLDVGYVDLLLLHGANHAGLGACGELACSLNAAQWRVYQEYYAAGKARAIGVSNYCPSCLACIMPRGGASPGAGTVPAVNQIRYHAGMTADPDGIMGYSRAHGVVPMAYSPMGSGAVFTDALLARIGAAHGKTSAQVALRWIAAKNYTLATKASSSSHMQEDMDIFSWSLTDEETAEIDEHATGSDTYSWACTTAEYDAVTLV